jgi:hypothetical protein
VVSRPAIAHHTTHLAALPGSDAPILARLKTEHFLVEALVELEAIDAVLSKRPATFPPDGPFHNEFHPLRAFLVDVLEAERSAALLSEGIRSNRALREDFQRRAPCPALQMY